MKEWSKPELLSLGVKNTFENEGEVSAGDNIHYCHEAGTYHLTTECNHPRNNHHQTSDHPEHNWDGLAHVSKCCCTEPMSAS